MVQSSRRTSADNGPSAKPAARPAVTTGSARSMLITVLGELVHPNEQPVWTSSLLYMLVGMGIEQRTARQAISRASASGWIIGHRQGREVRWELTENGKQLMDEGAKRVYSLHADSGSWDGNWLILLVTIPEAQRSMRKTLYTALDWEGFGNPTPGVWVSPHIDRETQARRVIDELDLKASTLAFIGKASDIGQTEQEIVSLAWDLDEVTEKYEELLIRYSGLQPAQGDPLLFTHVKLVNEWQRFPFMDPQLPAELLPNWIGRRAAVLFHQLRSAWYEDAQQRWREVVKETSPS
ncbi:PaaX family transcriptional regulator [Saccharopolyspora sp. HNM0986]|uniref:PaaX family transcriptional regulator n=1 Tax=Saccharopolyspora galaxeae TaxID=2781241 RepID=UPI00190A1AA8|nr:PaaX family transcriptional regulator C-terminal domain-containing protein [Saccharopolyspora sp. HNM0986]MBK0870404.1 PaaX family transcriptional regulator [Saccharopolyspora sp. HNM0986]